MNSRERRLARRREQRQAEALEKGASTVLAAAASGSKDLPLSDRDAPWDAGAAKKGLSEAQYASAHFWRDPDGDPKTLAAYKLPFARATDGSLTAVWKGVTASAAAIQGARGGVKIPDADVAAVKSRIASYYAKAREEYGDDAIQVPWAGDAAADAAALTPERAALAATTEALLHNPKCACGHSFDEHTGSDGPCNHEDGRGVCSCGGFSELAVEGSSQLEQELTQDVTISLEGRVDDVALSSLLLAGAEATVQLPGREEPLKVRLTDFAIAPAPALDVELPEALAPGDTRPAPNPNPAAPEVETTRDDAAGLRWNATIVPEATLTDDGRAIAPGALTWRELPLTLMAMVETTEQGHDGALVAGRIDRIWREGNLLKAEGVFDGAEFGLEVARMVGEGTLRGVSVDLAIHSYEVGPRGDWFDEDGNWAPSEAAAVEEEEPSLLEILFGDEDGDPPIFVITDAVIGATTVCPFQAFADATIELAASLVSSLSPAIATVTGQAGFVVTREPVRVTARDVLRAAAVEVEVQPDGTLAEVGQELGAAFAEGFRPSRPPAAWFADPGLQELTPLTIDADGRVYGHAWAWDTCHLSFPGACTTAPHSNTDYTYFLLKEVECDDGSLAPVGTITLGTGHADKRLDRASATAHYDDVRLAVADVSFGEDEHGGWFAGALRSDDPQKASELRGAVLSGDWRNVDGNLELVALLAVNVPGFPVPRTRALVSSVDGELEVLALVAAGIHVSADDLPDGLSAEDLVRLDALRARADRRFSDLAARVAG